MGNFSRWFSRSRKKNKEESSHNPLFKAFNSTPTLDDVSPDLERLEVATRLPLARTDVKQLPEKRTGTKTTQKCKETKSSRVDPESRNRDPERWKQQLLAWRLSAYEDARQWEMIDADTHKILKHHAFLSPGNQPLPDTNSTIRPSQSAPARSQFFPDSLASRPVTPSPSPRKQPSSAHPLPPSSWNRPSISQIQSDPNTETSQGLTSSAHNWGSFLSIPSSPTRSRSRFLTSRSITSLSIGSSSAHGDRDREIPGVLRKERKRDSLKSPFPSRPLDLDLGPHTDDFTARAKAIPPSSRAEVEANSTTKDLELLSREKRGLLTDDSPAISICAEWARTKAEMRIVCAGGGLRGVVGRVEREVEVWKRKCRVQELLNDAQGEVEEELRMVRELIRQTSQEGVSPLPLTPLPASSFLEVPSTPNYKRASIESLDTVMPTLDNQSTSESFLAARRLRQKPSFVSLDVPSPDVSPSKSPGKPRRTPSHLSGKSVQSMYSDLNRKATATGSSLFGSSKQAIKVSRPITPVQSIINRNIEDGLALQQVDPDSTRPDRVSDVLLLGDLRKLEMALCKLVRELNRLESVRLLYQERVDLLEVKTNGAELRDRLGR